jgi:hypothetical protein
MSVSKGTNRRASIACLDRRDLRLRGEAAEELKVTGASCYKICDTFFNGTRLDESVKVCAGA